MTAIVMALAFLTAPAADDRGDATWYGAGGSCVDGFLRTCSPYLSGERHNYAAVGSWRWGKKPYHVWVCAVKTGNCVFAIVRDFCLACKNKHGVIDLSPKLFRQLAPLGHGRIKVTVKRIVPVTKPPPSQARGGGARDYAIAH